MPPKALLRRPAKREAPTDDGDEPPAKRAKVGNDYAPLDYNKTDLVQEAKRRIKMQRPEQADLVFFWVGYLLRHKSGPRRAEIDTTPKNCNDNDQMACCQRTASDCYKFEVHSRAGWELGFVRTINWENALEHRNHPYLSCEKNGNAFEMYINTRMGAGKRKILGNPGKVMRFTLQVEAKSVTISLGTQKYTFLANPKQLITDDSLLAFYLHSKNDWVSIV